MIQGIYSSTAGMINQEIMLDVITNNLANASTPGYKRDEVSFSGMFNSLPTPETYIANPLGIANLDTVSAKFATDHSQGGMQKTGNSLDLALEGDGFFAIQHPTGIRYTRTGNFLLNNTGELVTPDGYPVLGTNGVIQIGANKPEIKGSGQIAVNGVPVEQLRLVNFQNTNDLIKGGHNTFILNNPAAAQIPAAAEVKQGFLEYSNVNTIQEMVKMIEAMRVYESYQKTIQSINSTLEDANKQLGKISI